jgi:secondary thiamine-phosphate synthase enzyme
VSSVEKFTVSTPVEGFVDITASVAAIVWAGGVAEGICHVYVPHTTAGVTVNENADPDVTADMLAGLDRLVPRLPYRHAEGNSPAHIKASLLGAAATVPISGGDLYLGTWQAIYLGEFDGPRRRTVCVTLVSV